MAHLFAVWLNEEVGLSKEVQANPHAMAEDFSNGYLLGELLHKYNQLHSEEFAKISNESTANQKIKNFCVLEPVFRRLTIPFNTDTAWKLLSGQPGAIMDLLYQIKIKVGQIASGPNSIVGPAVHDEIRLNNMPNRLTRTEYDASQSEFFQNSIRTIVEPQTKVNMRKVLLRFTDRAIENRRTAEEGARLQQRQEVEEFERKRQERRDNRAAEHSYLADWNERGIEQWGLNIERMWERKRRIKKFKKSVASKRAQGIAQLEIDGKKTVEKDIAQFDDFLHNLTIQSVKAEQEGEKVKTKHLNETKEAFEKRLVETLKDSENLLKESDEQRESGDVEALHQLKQRRQKQEANRRQHKRRRDHFLSSFDKRSTLRDEMSKKWRQRRLFAKESHVEKSLKRQMNNIRTFAKVFTENKTFFERQLVKRSDLDDACAIHAEHAITSNMTEKYIFDTMNMREKLVRFEESAKGSHFAQTYEMCRDIMSDIYDSSLLICEQRELLGSSHALKDFAAGEQIYRDVNRFVTLRANSEMAKDNITKPLISTYGMWTLNAIDGKVSPSAEQKGDEIENVIANTNSADTTTIVKVNNYMKLVSHLENKASEKKKESVGNVLRSIKEIAEPIAIPEKKPSVKRMQYHVCFQDKQLSGGAFIVDMIAEKAHLEVIKAEELVQLTLSNSNSDSDLRSRIIQSLAMGGVVSDDVLVELVVKKIQSISNHSVEESDSYEKLAKRESEILGNLSSLTKDESDDRLRLIFQAWDKDDSGFVDMNEMISAVTSTSGEDSSFLGDAREILAMMDTNSDHVVSLEEFLQFWNALSDDGKLFQDAEFQGVISQILLSTKNPHNGWILYNFPKTLQQAKLLERHLSGYEGDWRDVVPKSLLENTTSFFNTPDGCREVIATPTPKPNPDPSILIPGGLDLVIHLSVPDNITFKRAAGQFFTDEVGEPHTEHHLEWAPTKSEDCVLSSLPQAKIYRSEDRNSHNAVLASSIRRQHFAEKKMIDWFKRFHCADLSGEYDTPKFPVYTSVLPFLPNGGSPLRVDAVFDMCWSKIASLDLSRDKYKDAKAAVEAHEKAHDTLKELFGEYYDSIKSMPFNVDMTASKTSALATSPVSEDASNDESTNVVETNTSDENTSSAFCPSIPLNLQQRGKMFISGWELKQALQLVIDNGFNAIETWSAKLKFRMSNIIGKAFEGISNDLDDNDMIDEARFVQLLMNLVENANVIYPKHPCQNEDKSISHESQFDAFVEVLRHAVLINWHHSEERMVHGLFDIISSSCVNKGSTSASFGKQALLSLIAKANEVSIDNSDSTQEDEKLLKFKITAEQQTDQEADGTSLPPSDDTELLEALFKPAEGEEEEEKQGTAIESTGLTRDEFYKLMTTRCTEILEVVEEVSTKKGGKSKGKGKSAPEPEEEAEAQPAPEPRLFWELDVSTKAKYYFRMLQVISSLKPEVDLEAEAAVAQKAKEEAEAQALLENATFSVSVAQHAYAGINVVISTYGQDMAYAFDRLRELHSLHVSELEQVRRQFNAYIARPTLLEKKIYEQQLLVDDMEQDMRFDDEVKAELHQRVEDKYEEILTMFDTVEKENNDELTLIKSDNFVREGMENITSTYIGMIQCEFDLWFVLYSVLQMYFYEDATHSGKEYIVPAAVFGDGEEGDGASDGALLFQIPKIIDLADGLEADEQSSKGGKSSSGKGNSKKGKDNGKEEEVEEEGPITVGEKDCLKCEKRLTSALEKIFSLVDMSSESLEALVDSINSYKRKDGSDEKDEAAGN
eukprot:g3852.t1